MKTCELTAALYNTCSGNCHCILFSSWHAMQISLLMRQSLPSYPIALQNSTGLKLKCNCWNLILNFIKYYTPYYITRWVCAYMYCMVFVHECGVEAALWVTIVSTWIHVVWTALLQFVLIQHTLHISYCHSIDVSTSRDVHVNYEFKALQVYSRGTHTVIHTCKIIPFGISSWVIRCRKEKHEVCGYVVWTTAS